MDSSLSEFSPDSKPAVGFRVTPRTLDPEPTTCHLSTCLFLVVSLEFKKTRKRFDVAFYTNLLLSGPWQTSSPRDSDTHNPESIILLLEEPHLSGLYKATDARPNDAQGLSRSGQGTCNTSK